MKLITGFFTLVGLLTVLGVTAVTVAVALLWWQDKQWQAKAAQEAE